MKKVLSFLVLFLMTMPFVMRAQELVNYAFTATNANTFTSIASTGTACGCSTDDSYGAVALPFNFKYGENLYLAGTNIYVVSNGYITLDGNTTSTDPAPTSTTTSFISPLGHDLNPASTYYSGTKKVVYETSGTAPNRVMTIEWNNVPSYYTPYNVYNFQVKLHETTNVIEFCYGHFTMNPSKTPYVLLSDHNNSQILTVVSNGSTNWSQYTTSTIATSYTLGLSTSSYPDSTLVYTFTPPVVTCPKPTNLAVTNPTANSLDVSWLAGGTETSWQVMYYPGSDTMQAQTQVVNATSTTISGLTANTLYTVYVKALCGVGDESFYRGPVARTTLYNVTPATLPYTCDFENATENANWTFENDSATNVWSVGTAVNNTTSGTSALYISNDNGVSNAYTQSAAGTVYAVRDIILDTTYAYYSFNFDWKGMGESSNDYFRLYLGENYPSPIVGNHTGTVTTPAGSVYLTVGGSGYLCNQATWKNVNLVVNRSDGWGGGALRLYFMWTNNSSGGVNPPVSIDNIVIKGHNCLRPTNLVCDQSTLTQTQATISWTRGGASDTQWEIVWGLPGMNPNLETPVSVTDTTYTITGLTHSTNYYAFVRTVCGTETSSWVSLSFNSACGEISSLPYTENFDSYTATNSSATNVLPLCWNRINAGSSYSGYPTIYNNSSYAYSGTNALSFYSYTSTTYADQYAIMPPIDTTAHAINTLMLTFQLKERSSSYTGQVVVGVMTDPTNVSTFVPVQTLATTSDSYAPQIVSFANFTGYGNYIALKAPHAVQSVNSYYNEPMVDDIQLSLIPACPYVTGLHYTDASQPSSISLAWNGNASATSYEIAYGPTGIDPSATTTSIEFNITDTFATINGLTAGTTYDFYVRGNCGSEVSPWSINHVTAAPGSYNMGTSGTDTLHTCGAVIYDNGGISGNYANNCDANVIVYPSTDSLLVLYGSCNRESCCDELVIYEGVGVSGTPLFTSSGSNQSETFGPITVLTGPVTIHFESDVSVAYSGFEIHTSCIAAPSCPYIQGFSLSGTQSGSISLNWQGATNANSYSIIYGVHGFSTATAGTTITNITDTFTTITGLSNDTLYDFYIQADCGFEIGNWSPSPVTAQPGAVNMPTSGTTTISMCGGVLYDDGGLNGEYSDDCSSIMIINPSSADSLVSLSGSCALESCCDHLYIYDGAGIAGTQLFSSSGTNTIAAITSTLGPLTVRFVSDGSVHSYSGFALNISCVAAPSCRIPTAVTVASLDTADATITWNGYNNSQWQVVYSTTNGTPDSAAIANAISVSTTSISLQNLTPATTYYLYVRADCSPDYSAWSVVTIFTTACVSANIPVTYSFEADAVGSTAAFPVCWTRVNNAQYNTYPYVSSSNANTGSHSLYFYNYSSSYYDDNSYAVMPFFDATAHPINTLQLNLYGRMSYSYSYYMSKVVVGLMSSPANPSSFTPIDTIDFTTANYQNFIIPFNNYQGTNTYVAFRFPKSLSSSVYYNSGYLDDITLEAIPSCPKPMYLAATSGADNVQLNWTEYGSATSWDIIYGPTGFDPAIAGTTISGVTSHPYIITGLSTDTLYDFYVRAICSATEFSDWSLHTSSQPGQYLVPASGTDTIHVCSGHIFDNGGLNGQYGNSQDGYLVIYPSTQNALIHLTGSYITESVSFDWIDVYDGVGATGTSLAHVGGTGTLDVQSTTGPLTLRFRTDGSGVRDGFDLTVSCVAGASCGFPSAVAANNVQTTSADISWTAASNDATYLIEYGTTGFATGTGTVVPSSTTSVTITGLTAATAYDAYVRSICTAGDTTDYMNLVTFTTECNTITSFPYTEGFEHAGNMPNCWSQSYVSGSHNWTFSAGDVEQSEITAAHGGSYNALFAGESDDYVTKLISPVFDLTQVTNPYVSYWHAQPVWISDQDTLAVYYRTSATGTWTYLRSFTSSINTWTFDSIPLPNASATYQIAFQGYETYGYGVVLDDITVNGDTSSSTSCDAPTGLAAAPNTTSAVLSWTETGNFEVSYKATASTTWSANTAVSGSTTTINGLTAATAYDWRVRKVCDATTSSAWATGTFTTNAEATCPMPTNFQANPSNTSVVLSWTQEAGTATEWTLNYKRSDATTWTTSTVTTNPYTIVDLTENTAYQAQIRANCTNGTNSDYTEVINFTTVGINDYTLANSISLYPNPTSNYIDVRVNNPKLKVSEMRVYDVYGKLLQTIIVNDNPTRINVSSLANGMYFVRVISDKGVANKSFIKK